MITMSQFWTTLPDRWNRMPDRRIDLVVTFGLVIAAIIWSAIGGKDLNWDQLNYHFYLPYSLFENRLALDFVPANGQSYLNPFAYVPFYWMVRHDWNSLLVATVLAIMHSANAVLAYHITLTATPKEMQQNRLVALLGAVLAFLSPVFLMEIGTTFADVSTSALVLGAILCGLKSDREDAWWKDYALYSGALMGAAGALKLSNLVFGPACALLICCAQPKIPAAARKFLLYGLGATAGIALAQGYWGWLLWKEFGNPVFPLFGNLFPTDVFPKEGAPLERFLPTGLLDVLTLPFRMVQLRAWIYIENVAPDLRFAAVLFAGLALLLSLLLTRIRARLLPVRWADRRYLAIIACFLLAYSLWIWTSGNGRYGLVVSLLCGPILALVICSLSRNWQVNLWILAAIISLQMFHLQNGDLRWARGSWTSTWYEVSLPDRLKSEPYLYITVGGNSNSFVYPFLARDSAFTNPIGQIAFDFDRNGGKRLRKILSEHPGNIRVLAMAPSAELSEDMLDMWTPKLDSTISRLGYGIDRRDCEMITTAGSTTILGRDFSESDLHLKRLITCKVHERPFAYARERERATKVAQMITAWCPKLFKPAYSALERTTSGWTANYPSTDSVLLVNGEALEGVFSRSAATIYLGTLEQWEQGFRPDCSKFAARPRDAYNYD